MKEKTLVLATAAPTLSRKYQELVCVAGVTEQGNWRRIYPLRWEIFWNNSGKKFRKRQWLEYETESDLPSDHRQESRKILENTLKPLNMAKFDEIRKIILPKITTLEDLYAKSICECSLGIIKPKIIDFVEEKSRPHEKAESMKGQKTLSGKEAIRLDLPEKTYSYIFKCSETCPKAHKMICEDWEITELYRHCKKSYEANEVFGKIKQRMFDDMLKKKELYFVVGSHFIHPTFMIIGIIRPKKAEVQ